MHKPKRCPCCGGRADYLKLTYADESVWYFGCWRFNNPTCSRNPRTKYYNSEAEAIEAWNKEEFA